jgi:hypothetical protein
MRLEHWMVFAAILALLATGLVLACDDDDDDDDDDNDTAAGDDDDTAPDEEACVTAAKAVADEYCASLDLVRDNTHMGLGTSGAECYYYCGSDDYIVDYDCKDGLCICCIEG